MDEMRELVAEEIPHLRRFAVMLVGNEVIADDLVQDALERAWRKRYTWRRKGTLRSWLLRILYRTYLNTLRRQQNRTVEFDETLHSEAAGVVAEPQARKVELADFVRVLFALPMEQRAAIVLIALDGESYEVAADVLGMPLNTFRSKLFRGRSNLSRMMEEGGHRSRPRLRRVK